MNKLIEGKNKIVSFMQGVIRSRNKMIILSALLVLLCLLVYFIPIEIDFTRNNANSISKTAKKIVKNIDVKDDELNVYYFSAIVNSDIDNYVYDRVKTVFTQLKKYNKKINYEIIDLNTNSNALVEYKMAETKCILIKHKDKYYTIPFDDFVYSYDDVLEVDVEQKIIEKIVEILDKNSFKIYYTIGHGEKINNEEFSEFKTLLFNFGYELNELDLNDGIPSDAKMIYIFAPQRDFTKEEIVTLDDFLLGNNNLFITLSGQLGKDDEDNYDYCPNLVSFYHNLGINVSDKVAVDQIQDTKLIGIYSEYDEDTKKVQQINSTVVMPDSRVITVSSINNNYDIVESIISGELTGYPLVIKLTNKNNKILITASSDMFSDSNISTNKGFISYLVNWVDNFEYDFNIEPFLYKDYVPDFTDFKTSFVLGIIEIMIPLAVLYIGYEIFRKRVSSTKSKIMK